MAITDEVSSILKFKVLEEGAGTLKSLSVGFLGVGAAAVVMVEGFKKSFEASKAWEEQLRGNQLQLGATKEQMKTFSDEVMTLGRGASQPLSDLANALVVAGKSGATGAAGMKEMHVAIEAATVSGKSVASTMSNLTAVMAQWAIPTKDAAKTMDIIAAASQHSRISLDEFGPVMAKLSGGAKLAGLSMNETAAAMAALSQQGMPAGRAASSLQTTILALATAHGKAKDAMLSYGQAAGVDLVGAIDNLKNHHGSLATVLADVQKASGGNVDVLKEMGIAGKSATAVTALATTQSGAYATALAAEAASHGKLHGLYQEHAGDIDVVMGRIKNLGQEVMIWVGQKIMPLVSGMLHEFEGLAKWFESHSKPITAFFSAIGDAATRAMTTLKTDIGTIISTVGGLLSQADNLKNFSTAWDSIKDAAGHLGGALKDLIAPFTSLGSSMDAGKGKGTDFSGVMSTLTGIIKDVAGGIDLFAKGLEFAAPLIGPLVVGIGAYVVVTKAVTLATEAWAGMQAILNGTLAANPIGVVVAVVAALAIGVLELYNHWKPFHDFVNVAFAKLKELGDYLGTTLTPVMGAIGTAIGTVSATVGTWVTSLQTGKGAVEGLTPAITDASGVLGTIATILKDVVTVALQTAGDAFHLFATVVGVEITIAKDAIQTILDLIGGIATVIGDALTLVTDIFTGKWGKVWDDTKKLAGDVVGVFTTLGSDLSTLIGDALNGIGQIIGAWVTLVVNFFGNLSQQILGDKIPKLMSGIVTFFTDLPGNVATALAPLPGKAVAVFEALKTKLATWMTDRIADFLQWGKEIPGKIADGLSDPTKLMNAIKKLVTDAVSGAKDGVAGLLGDFGSWIVGMIAGGIGNSGWADKVHAASNAAGSAPGPGAFGLPAGTSTSNGPLDLFHAGVSNAVGHVDYASASGTPFYLPGGAGANYKLTSSYMGQGYGLTDVFSTPGGGQIDFEHMNSLSGMKTGQTYHGGQEIGLTGGVVGVAPGLTAAHSTGAHLHSGWNAQAQAYISAQTGGTFGAAYSNTAASANLDFGKVPAAVSKYSKEILASAAKYGVSPQFIAAVIQGESSGNKGAISPTGAVGLMQLEPYNQTVQAKGLTPGQLTNPAINIDAGTAELKRLLDGPAHGNMATALAMYNAGQYASAGTLGSAGVQGYVKSVMGNAASYAGPGHAGGPAVINDPSGGIQIPYGTPGTTGGNYGGITIPQWKPTATAGLLNMAQYGALGQTAATSATAPAYASFGAAQTGFQAEGLKGIPDLTKELVGLPKSIAEPIKAQIAVVAQNFEQAGAKFNTGLRAEDVAHQTALHALNTTHAIALGKANNQLSQDLGKISQQHTAAVGAAGEKQAAAIAKVDTADTAKRLALATSEQSALNAENAKFNAARQVAGADQVTTLAKHQAALDAIHTKFQGSYSAENTAHQKALASIGGTHIKDVAAADQQAQNKASTARNAADTAYHAAVNAENKRHAGALGTVNTAFTASANSIAAEQKKIADEIKKAMADSVTILASREKGPQNTIAQATAAMTLAIHDGSGNIDAFASKLAAATTEMTRWQTAQAIGTVIAGLATGSISEVSTGLGTLAGIIRERVIGDYMAQHDVATRLIGALAKAADAQERIQVINAGLDIQIAARRDDLAGMGTAVQTFVGLLDKEWTAAVQKGGGVVNQYSTQLVAAANETRAITAAQNAQSIVLGQLTGNYSQMSAGLQGVFTTATDAISYFTGMVGRSDVSGTAAGNLQALTDTALTAANNLGTLPDIIAGIGKVVADLNTAGQTQFARTGGVTDATTGALRDAQGKLVTATWDQVGADLQLAQKTQDVVGYYTAMGKEITLQQDKLVGVGLLYGQQSDQYKAQATILTNLQTEYAGLGAEITAFKGNTVIAATELTNATAALAAFKSGGADAATDALKGMTAIITTAATDLKGALDTATSGATSLGTAMLSLAGSLSGLVGTISQTAAALANITTPTTVNVTGQTINLSGVTIPGVTDANGRGTNPTLGRSGGPINAAPSVLSGTFAGMGTGGAINPNDPNLTAQQRQQLLNDASLRNQVNQSTGYPTAGIFGPSANRGQLVNPEIANPPPGSSNSSGIVTSTLGPMTGSGGLTTSTLGPIAGAGGSTGDAFQSGYQQGLSGQPMSSPFNGASDAGIAWSQGWQAGRTGANPGSQTAALSGTGGLTTSVLGPMAGGAVIPVAPVTYGAPVTGPMPSMPSGGGGASTVATQALGGAASTMSGAGSTMATASSTMLQAATVMHAAATSTASGGGSTTLTAFEQAQLKSGIVEGVSQGGGPTLPQFSGPTKWLSGMGQFSQNAIAANPLLAGLPADIQMKLVTLPQDQQMYWLGQFEKWGTYDMGSRGPSPTDSVSVQNWQPGMAPPAGTTIFSPGGIMQPYLVNNDVYQKYADQQQTLAVNQARLQSPNSPGEAELWYRLASGAYTLQPPKDAQGNPIWGGTSTGSPNMGQHAVSGGPLGTASNPVVVSNPGGVAASNATTAAVTAGSAAQAALLQEQLNTANAVIALQQRYLDAQYSGVLNVAAHVGAEHGAADIFGGHAGYVLQQPKQ